MCGPVRRSVYVCVWQLKPMYLKQKFDYISPKIVIGGYM